MNGLVSSKQNGTQMPETQLTIWVVHACVAGVAALAGEVTSTWIRYLAISGEDLSSHVATAQTIFAKCKLTQSFD